MEIKIPRRLEEKMGEDLGSECKNVFKKFEKFATSEMYFFPEYTDHSYRHIQYVLETANNLIPNETLNVLTKNDAFILCLGILFHDLGMHITLRALKAMYELNPTDTILKKNFVSLWKEYVDKNKVSKDIADLTEVNESIVESHRADFANFIRGFHPMIANIIAVKGFPLFDDEGKAAVESYQEKSKEYFYKLSGIVARSHGEDLRVMVDYLQEHYGMMWKTPYDCHIVYLMCIVRIADYLHITDDRINPYRLNLLEFHSDKSKTEYLKHQSVEYSQRIYGNPEIIYIEAAPTNCKIFIELIDLLKCIQFELDSSWAVLGEVYDVSQLKLSIRRVTSNILEEEWQKSSKFVADKLKFHFDPRLIDLLIEPLYGKSASYGIRELIQNATDACKTRMSIFGEEDYKPEVRISINTTDNKKYLKIEDNGTGMSLDIIKNHFLNIGSKFRESSEWDKLKRNEQDKSEVLEKNGKFGIGILSSYLLGDDLKVVTCNCIEKIKYEFETKKDTVLIEIKKSMEEKSEYGTKIEIELKDNIRVDKLIIDEWYVNKDIPIRVEIQDRNSKNRELIDLVEDGDETNKNSENESEKKWKRLDVDKDINIEIYWTYKYLIPPMYLEGKNEGTMIRYSPNLVSNGIVIPKNYDEKNKSSIVKKWPTVYVIDKNGELDLNLSRDELNGKLPFSDELETDLLDNFMKQYRDYKNNGNFNKGSISTSQFNITNYYEQKLAFGKQGYILFNYFFLKRIQENYGDIKVVRIWTKKNMLFSVDKMLDENFYYVFEGVGSHPYLKPRIKNYCTDTPFDKANIYMKDEDIQIYKDQKSNLYKLSKQFYDENQIHMFREYNDFSKQIIKLDIDQEDICLVIVYSLDDLFLQNGEYKIFDNYYSNGEDILERYE